MSINIKLSKAQTSKIIQSGGFFDSWLGNLGKKALTNIAIPLVRDNLPELVSNLTSNAVNKFERNISGKGAVRAWKILLVDGVTETVKYEKEKREGGFLGVLVVCLATSLVPPVISSVVKHEKWRRS